MSDSWLEGLDVYAVAPETLIVEGLSCGFGVAYMSDGGDVPMVCLRVNGHPNGRLDEMVELELMLPAEGAGALRDSLNHLL